MLVLIQDILGQMQSLDDLPLETVEPSSYAIDQDHFQRDDVIETHDNLNLSKNAPKWQDHGHAFHVPKILKDS